MCRQFDSGPVHFRPLAQQRGAFCFVLLSYAQETQDNEGEEYQNGAPDAFPSVPVIEDHRGGPVHFKPLAQKRGAFCFLHLASNTTSCRESNLQNDASRIRFMLISIRLNIMFLLKGLDSPVPDGEMYAGIDFQQEVNRSTYHLMVPK